MIYDPMLRDLVTALDLADTTIPAIPVDMPISDLLERFQLCDTGLLPVVDTAENRKVVGVVEQRDLLQALHRDQNV